MSTRAPKQWSLTKTETVTSYEAWRANLQYTLSLDIHFAPFLQEGTFWLKKSKSTPLRGFTADGQEVPEDARRSAEQKVAQLELMLGQIANFCPIIARNAIVKNSTSIESVWQMIRSHYGFQSTGAHFLDFDNIKLDDGERPEDLYQRLLAFVEDNLLTRESGISHHGEQPTEDEEVSPSLENFIILTWLRLIHTKLPKLVKQRYGTELRSRTLASLKPEISQAMESLLEELRACEDVKVMRSSNRLNTKPQNNNTQKYQTHKSCPVCCQAGRADYKHFLSQCRHLPESDRKYLARARILTSEEQFQTETSFEAENCSTYYVSQNTLHPGGNTVSDTSRVQVTKSPFLSLFYKHHPLHIVIDSGAETNMVRTSIAKQLEVRMKQCSQRALQADGRSPLSVAGEIKITLTRDGKNFELDALVVDNLDVDVLAGVPFMECDDISVQPATHEVLLHDGTSYKYNHNSQCNNGPHIVRRTQGHVLRAPSTSTTVWPGEFIELDLPPTVEDDSDYALEPRYDGQKHPQANLSTLWPKPELINSVGRKVRICNNTNEPQSILRNQHIAQVHYSFNPLSNPILETDCNSPSVLYTRQNISSKTMPLFSETVCLDPDNILPQSVKSQFIAINKSYDSVFNPEITGYNGAMGPFQATVNMGPVLPPQRKGRLPQYGRDKLLELQAKFDELESVGVFKCPEELGIVAEYLNPSFLVKKPNGSHRLVTAFADVGRYSKPQPALMTNVDATFRTIGQWKHIITTDMTQAFYQIPLSRDSMKFCGVVTPFRGVRVYTRAAMGMPGSETALEELMSLILSDLLAEGGVTKLADDLYCGGSSYDELTNNWTRVLQAFSKSDIRLSASKTIIAPKSTVVLGWLWQEGSLRASPHRIAALASCSVPSTVGSLRSFIGAYKVLGRVIPQCSSLLGLLDTMVAGRTTNDKLTWTDDLLAVFHSAQKHLNSNKTIVLPRQEDTLWVVTDAAVKAHGIGATLYVVRDEKPLLAGFFSAKLRKHQVTWLPCEVKALSIAAAVKHFSPYIIQSVNQVCVLTDSKPCVQAYEKLCRGEFSASPRVSTFLSTVSRYQVSIRHISGQANAPSDFASRNAPECDDPECRICQFIARSEDSVVRQVSIQDILSGKTKLPFTSHAAWVKTQSECPDLRRTRAHLTQGTRPSKKDTDIGDVKRYLNVVSLTSDGLLVVKKSQPLAPDRDCIVIPRSITHGIVTALHIKLGHPTSHQLKAIMRRYFFALDLDGAIESTTTSCHTCVSLKSVPKMQIPQTTSAPPDVIGQNFAADVIKRHKQLILVVRECVTSLTQATLIENETKKSLCDALIQLCVPLRPLEGNPAVIRTDPASGFKGLVKDTRLQAHNLSVELGQAKNPNKNPVAERAVQELEMELLRLDPQCSTVTPLTLSLAVSHLNTRLRAGGLSSQELWTQRDQFTHLQIPLSDKQVIQEQHERRLENHPHSMKAKAQRKQVPFKFVTVGDLVYLKSDRDKNRCRDRYLVVSIDPAGEWCDIRKFIGSQLRADSYHVRQSDCLCVPQDSRLSNSSNSNQPLVENDDSDDELDIVLPPLPPIPSELSRKAEPSATPECPPPEPSASPALIPRRSTRSTKKPSYLNNYHCNDH